MSRIGQQPITLPSGVTLTVDKSQVIATGPKGSLTQKALQGVEVETAESQVMLKRGSDEPGIKARHGLMRSLLQNMVTGVSQGFERKLELSGVGYRVSAQGQDLKFNLGFSHDVVYKVPAEVQVSVDQNIITVSGIDKQKVGQVAAEIRALKKPEPYKGKGIKYVNEQIIRKSGKSGKETAA
ncbi:MAG TPA: 50S ribosomal protein L6 [Candidatus Saccharimonadales bacterium]|nr:50S ribosomal protein L6 [Candidatus Saccharimonadales bacterium]